MQQIVYVEIISSVWPELLAIDSNYGFGEHKMSGARAFAGLRSVFWTNRESFYDRATPRSSRSRLYSTTPLTAAKY